MIAALRQNFTLECHSWHTSATPYTTDTLNYPSFLVAANIIEYWSSPDLELVNDSHTHPMLLANLTCLGLSLLHLTARLVYVRKLSKQQSFHVIELSNLLSNYGLLKDPHAPRPSW